MENQTGTPKCCQSMSVLIARHEFKGATVSFAQYCHYFTISESTVLQDAAEDRQLTLNTNICCGTESVHKCLLRPSPGRPIPVLRWQLIRFFRIYMPNDWSSLRSVNLTASSCISSYLGHRHHGLFHCDRGWRNIRVQWNRRGRRMTRMAWLQ